MIANTHKKMLTFKLKKYVRKLASSNQITRHLWSRYREETLLHEYRKHRAYYSNICNKNALCYDENNQINSIRNTISKRGYTCNTRRIGEIHTFAFIPSVGWHNSLLPDLQELGPLSVFDYTQYGYSIDSLYQANKKAILMKKEINQLFYSKVMEAHSKQPIDWIFIYANGFEISSPTLRKISENIGVPLVNMCLDDKQSWTGPFMGDHSAGQISICKDFDISWTSARTACEWYLGEGANPIYLPEGFDISQSPATKLEPDIPVSFVGGSYGYRPLVIDYLKKNLIPIEVFGNGWREAGWALNPIDIYSRSLINLGMGGIGFSEKLTNVKGRDFEIPAVGSGVYITSFNSDLAQHFVIGKEIVCYSNRDELLELIRHYLTHPDEAKVIANKGQERCNKEHRWLHRYLRICEILGITQEQNGFTLYDGLL